jgi:branched-chain amino acid aminotransferase
VDVTLIRKILDSLIRHNGLLQGNIRLLLHIPYPGEPCLYAYFIPHVYPTPVMYASGVDTGLFKAVRVNPNVKRMFPVIRDKISHFIRSGNLYEALLVKNNIITEGSKSNVFFIKGDAVLTPPADLVLKGITRKKVFELCKRLDIVLMETKIPLNSLTEFQAAFLTGTSPKLLAIRRIGAVTLEVQNPIITSLTKAYDDLISVYVQQHRHA